MRLKHIHKRAVKNSMSRTLNELDRMMYPLGLKEEMKYVEDLNNALNRRYSKVKIANMLRRIMSYVILTNTPLLAAVPMAKKVIRTIPDKEMAIVIRYIKANNQYIAKLNLSHI